MEESLNLVRRNDGSILQIFSSVSLPVFSFNSGAYGRFASEAEGR